MNKSKFFNVVFIISGSFILITLLLIVGMNFMKDARVFQQDVAKTVQDTGTKKLEKQPEEVEEPNKKIIVKTGDKDSKEAPAKQDASAKKTEKKEDIQKDGEPAIDPLKEKMKVEVINYSGIKRAAEELKSTLEASGYEVSAGNEKSNKPVRTEIIDRNDKKAGAGIQKLLKIGFLTKAPDPTSRFDVTIKIGDDYKP